MKTDNIGVRRVTNPPYHHLVGFNDLDPLSKDYSQLLCLRVESMKMPTDMSVAEVGCVDLESGNFRSLGRTTGWNFPQGGRQQWTNLQGHEGVLFNVAEKGIWKSVLVSATGSRLALYDRGVYCQSRDGRYGYGLNYARIYRLGGYGYPGLIDPTSNEAAPSNDGIWEIDLCAGFVKLIVSIGDVVAVKGLTKITPGSSHYITHIVPSPKVGHLAFLHRYWLPDGGIRTRLVVRDANTHDLEVWDEGFLSHFDWVDDTSILVWGRPFSGIQAIRSSRLLSSIPFAASTLQWIKPKIRKLLGSSYVQNGYFKQITREGARAEPFSDLLPRQDGHPSFCSSDRSILLTDTYPDENGSRDLMVIDIAASRIINLGRYEQADIPPIGEFESIASFVGADVIEKFDKTSYVYSHSGVHCDLHPRWCGVDRYVCFDSNHEGTRQVYLIPFDRNSINAK